MTFFTKVKSLVGLDFDNQAREEVRCEEEQAARKVVMRYSRGSVGLQKGAYQTRRDLDKAMKKAGL